jgi:hypothetical protein
MVNDGKKKGKLIRIAEIKKSIALGIKQAENGFLVDANEVFEKIRKKSARTRLTNTREERSS